MAEILVLGRASTSTWALCRALQQRFGELDLLVEEPEPRSRFLRRRIRLCGVVSTLGQCLFQLFGAVGRRRSAARRTELKRELGLDDRPLDPAEYRSVASVNSDEARRQIRALAPRVVVLSGTRIVSRRTLEMLGCPVLNVHAGITPQYRGVHGGYWSLARSDAARFGVTIHEVDAGVDTGDVVEQILVQPSPRDDFWSYPLLQLGHALPRLVEHVDQARRTPPPSSPTGGTSQQWFHPTLWGYVATGLRRGVW